MHVRYSRVRERNWAALSGIEITLAAAIGWGQRQRRGDLEHAGTSFIRERSTQKRARSSSRKARGKATGFTKNSGSAKTKTKSESRHEHVRRWMGRIMRKAVESEITSVMNERMTNATGTPDGAASNHATLARNAWRWRVRYEKLAKSFEDTIWTEINRGWTAPRRETSGQSRRREERKRETHRQQGFFPQPRTRASIHETYGFSARLMWGPVQWELLMAGLDVVLEREACSGYEVRGWASVSASSDLRMGTVD
ncbi:hypothetical protein EDB83DRAFT_2317312 [Lactarius deliciosus]|nr:hypothetical protein EDB83DRAFT_2317312 [Lactarius deliciosus]